jgi:nucleotide-binding universal stress UspA family protein
MTATFVRVADAARQGDRVTASSVAEYRTAGRIVVGVDDTPAGQAALRWAVAKAKSDGAPLVAVRAWALGLPKHGGRRLRHSDRTPVVLAFAGESQREAANALVRRVFDSAAGGLPHDVAVRIETPEGEPGEMLTHTAIADGDLLVLGEENWPSWMRIVHGSVSRYCSRHSRCAVVIVSAAEIPAELAVDTPGAGDEGSAVPEQARGAAS